MGVFLGISGSVNSKVHGKIIPCRISSVDYINDYRPRIVEKDEKERILNRIYTYSSKLLYGIQK